MQHVWLGQRFVDPAPFIRRSSSSTTATTATKAILPPTVLYAAGDSCPLVILSYTVSLPGSPYAPDFHPFRILFKIVLKIFYGTIVVEGMENIPQTGRPW